MAYSMKQLENLFAQADDAGNTEDAQAFLDEISKRKKLVNKERMDFSMQTGAYKPVDGTTGERGTDLRVAGFGRAFNATGQGIGQALGLVDQATVDESAKTDEALLDNPNGIIGNVASQMTQMYAPGTAISRTGTIAPKLAAMSPLARGAIGVGAAGVENGAFSATQPVVTGDTRVGNTAQGAAWGAGGKMAQGFLGQLAKGGSNITSKYMQDLQAEAAKRGISLGIPELSNNQFVQTISNQLGRLPFGGGASRLAKNKAAVNTAVSKTFGENSPAINSDVYNSAYTRLSGNYDKIKANNPLPLTKPLMDELGALQKDAASKFSGAGKSVKGFIDDIVNKSKNGELTGAQFKSLESELSNLSKAPGESGLYLAKLRDTLRSHWQDSVTKAGNSADSDLLKLTNSQYGALKTIRDLVAKEGGDGISPQALMGRVTAGNAGKERMARGTLGELGTIAKIGQKLKQPPNSGTADRALVNLMAAGAVGAGSGYAGSQGWISPELALLIGGGLVGNRLLNSKAASNYMVRGAPKPVAKLLEGVARPLPRAAAAIGITKAASEDSKKKKKG